MKKVVDAASRNICEARYFTVPLDNKVLAQNMPIATSPVNTVVDFALLRGRRVQQGDHQEVAQQSCDNFQAQGLQ